MWHNDKRGISVLKQSEDIVILPSLDEFVSETEPVATIYEEIIDPDDIQKTAENYLKSAKKQKEDAKKLLEDAKERAGNIIQAAMNESEAIRNKAFDQGFEEGKVNIKKEVEKLKQKQNQKFEKFLNDWQENQEEMLAELKNQVLEIIIELAKKILFIELKQNNEAMKNMINSAVANVGAEENKKILISKTDFERLQSDNNNDYLQLLKKKGVKLIVSHDMEEGECRADYQNGSINVGIDTQLKRANYIFEKELN